MDRSRATLFALALLAFGLFVSRSGAVETLSGRCVAVLDGDSIRVLHGRDTVEVRLEGIDAPEHRQEFAERAKKTLSDLVYDRKVEVSGSTTDNFGRRLGRVFVGGLDVNLEMVRRGLAWHYKRYSSDPALADAETAARARRAGLWVDPAPVPPWSYRRAAPAPSPSVDQMPIGGADAAPTEVHGNTGSRVFHSSSCPNFRCRNCTARFVNAEAAQAAGYHPAGCCHPR
jgi:endonuclease YncB( thermonuclease family)